MEKFKPYFEQYGRAHDFLVEYKLVEQSDFEVKLTQGMRSDFVFEQDFPNKGYMIWPEFDDAEGKLLNTGEKIPEVGKARMWIMVDESRQELAEKVVIGAKGYLSFGSHKVADATIIELN